MHARKHLFLALSRKGWGETTLGLNIARQVRLAGGQPTFVAHTGSLAALTGSGFDVEEITDAGLPFLPMLLENRILDERFASLILCDFLTTNYTLTRYGVDPQQILRYDVPVIAMDTWQFAATGSVVDVYGGHAWHIGDWIEKVEQRLVPVPIGQPCAKGAYSSLPGPIRVGKSVRGHIRKNLGLCSDDRAVLFCTAGWQHDSTDPDGRQVNGRVPELLRNYVSAIDPRVHLIHVGPAELDVPAPKDRYLWMPSLSPDNFERLLGSVDLFLSLNLSATTIGAAVMAGVPVLVAQNSFCLSTQDDVESCSLPPSSPRTSEWLVRSLPLWPFAVWPLGFRKFLRPLLDANPYVGALETVEILDEFAFLRIARELLFSENRRASVVARQSKYAASVHALPTAADRIAAYLH